MERGRGHVLPEAAFGTDAEVLEDEPDADLVLRVLETERARGQATDQVPGEHAGRRVAADGHALRHAAELGFVHARRAVRRRHELVEALQLRAEILRIVLVWRLVAGPIRRNEPRWRSFALAKTLRGDPGIPGPSTSRRGAKKLTLRILLWHTVGAHNLARGWVGHLLGVAHVPAGWQDVGICRRVLFDLGVRRRGCRRY